MQLKFTTIQQTQHKGVPCNLQRADVTGNGLFWAWWRKGNSPLRNTLTVKQEDDRYYVYRLMPLDLSLAYTPVLTPYSVRDTRGLLSYQPRAVSALCASLLRHGKALDGSDAGTGKTYISAAVCRELGYKAAVVCIKANIIPWQKVLNSFRVPFLFITNWEMIKRPKNPYCIKDERLKAYRWVLPPKTILIFDEAHVANHPSSLNYALFTASKPFPSISVSTTIGDRLEHLQHIFHLFNIIPEHAFSTWLRSRGHFEAPYDEMELEGLSDAQDMAETGKYLYTHYGCRLSISDPDVSRHFPDAQYEARLIDIGKTNIRKMTRAYSDMICKVKELYEMGKSAEALVANLRYRQTAELGKSHALAELAVNYQRQGNSVVIFVNFLDTLNYLSHVLHTTSLIYGSQKIPREKVISDFQADKTTVLIAMISAGGQSISLHDLNGNRRRVSLICPTYNPIHIKQCLGRTYRARSITPPLMQMVYSAGTIEEQVAERVSIKMQAIDSLNAGDLIESDVFNILGERVNRNV